MQYNPDELNDILNIFKAESEEIIQELNDGFMELEKNPYDKAPLKKLFQLSHSLKGAARMLGFNSIQNIAHKLEDILSYWKKENSIINTDIFQLIYQACDLLTDLVNKSIEIKTDYNSPEIYEFLNKLNVVVMSQKMVPVENPPTPDSKKITVNKNVDIKAILLELMFVLDKDDINEDIDEVFLVISDNLKQLSELLIGISNENIQAEIDSLYKYITENKEAKNSLNYIKQKIEDIRVLVYSASKELQLNSFSFQSQNIKKMKNEEEQKQEKEQEEVELSEQEKESINSLDTILSNLSSIKYDSEYIQKISEILNKILSKADNGYVIVILNKVINILNSFNVQGTLINNDSYVVILQSLNLVRRLILKERGDNTTNFILQRLSVIEDMFSVPENNNMNNVEVRDNGNIVAQEKFSGLKKTLNNLDLQEIKTLRVDTVKLDNLISQTGELLINGIKTREHIIELAKINEKLIKWNSVSKKIINYLKYLEKKGFFSTDTDDNSGMFFRRTQDFFTNNAEIINEINNDFSNLYNIISEDDNKLHQTTMEIESIAKGIRVLPLATLFHSFPRMIRDIAHENEKKVDFIISGSDTTVDKKIIEEIKMPLIHILRNAVSHGIETPENRQLNGKNEVGIVKLTAKQAENNVIITVEDDGYGINLEKVKEIAQKKGLLSEEELSNANNEQLMKLLFLPGFSTEETVTEISGRGIGLDVVKTKINNLNGEILIDSFINKGCKVTIRVPLSMSTIKAFIILINGHKYAMPVNTVKFVKQINRDEIFLRNGRQCIIYDEHSIPVYSLRTILGEEDTQEEHLTVILIENQDKQAAFIVDRLVGDSEVFHKKLVPPILRIKNISGFTTLSTGEICLIINPFELINSAS